MERARNQDDGEVYECPASIRRERAALGLVSGAHFFSHFYMLVLPLLFLAIQSELKVSFTQLGFIMTLYALGSASGQYPVGVLSDKLGPRWFLISGMTLLSVCFILMGFVASYWQLLLLAFLAGLSDSVFHPADFAVLTAQVNQKRLGRSYSVHAFMGFLGFAAAPVIVDFLRVNWDWHTATMIVGLGGLVMAFTLFIGRSFLTSEDRQVGVLANVKQEGPIGSIDLFKSGAILMLFAFYFVVAVAGTGITQFSTSALPLLYGVDVSYASRALFVYMMGISLGVLVGGVIADRRGRLDVIASIGYLVASTLMIVVSLSWFPFLFVIGAFFVGGLMTGAIFPSRDLMVRNISHKRSTGKAFGFVNSGFGYGGMISPLMYGAIMDTGFIQGVYLASAAIMMLAIATAIAASILAHSNMAVQAAE